MQIGIDLMGGDHTPSERLEGVLEIASQEYAGMSFILYATLEEQTQLAQVFGPQLKSLPQISFEVCPSFIAFDEEPMDSIKVKEDSTLVTGIRDLSTKRLDAFISAGNTGALILASYHYLPHLPKIERPALLVSVPTKQSPLAVLDVGGQVSCRAKHLVQYALMGAAYQKAMGLAIPKVALLNIGTEAYKGQIQHRQAYHWLETMAQEQQCRFKEDQSLIPGFSFEGNIEGRDVFNGSIDVLVTDGFAGNVFLKTSEGIALYVMSLIEDKIKQTGKAPEQWLAILSDLQKVLNYEEFCGALVCGVDALVIKCHGSSSKKAIANSIAGAYRLVQSSFLQQLHSGLEKTAELT